MKYKQHIGLLPNVSYGDFVLGSNINMYLSQEHTKKMYDEATFSNISYFFKREEINVWCDTDGKGNGQYPYKGVHHYPYMGIKSRKQ